MATKFPCRFKNLRSCIRLLARHSDRNIGQEGKGRGKMWQDRLFCGMATWVPGAECLPPGSITQSLSLPNDSFKIIPQHYSRKVWRAQVSRELCYYLLLDTPGVYINAQDLGIYKVRELYLSAPLSYRDRRTSEMQFIPSKNFKV